MKKLFFFISFNILAFQSIAQPKEYISYIKKADSLYNIKEYSKSASTYTEAFKANNGLGLVSDRYKAACAWAQINNSDSAFFHLNRLSERGGYSDIQYLINDKNLFSLHNDSRWKILVSTVEKNKEKEKNYNRVLIAQLDSILDADQKHRKNISEIEKQYGSQSRQMDSLWRIIHLQDSINLKKVLSILDKYGWLGPDVIGGRGSTALFLVIQHSNQKIQEKYLPMVREAVKLGKLKPTSLALLEDRVALGQGKRQIYGSQIQKDTKGKWIIAPIEDEKNVNERRKVIGLEPLEEYVKQWNIDYKLPK